MVGKNGWHVARDVGAEGDPSRIGSWLHDREHRIDDLVDRHRLERELHLVELDVRQIREVVEQPAKAFRVAEGDLEKAPRVLALLERAAEQRLEIALDRRERRAQLVRDVGDELGADSLEMPERRDVVEHEDDADAGLVPCQHERHGVDLHGARHRREQPHLAMRHGPRAAHAAPADERVEIAVANDFHEGLALAARRHTEDRARSLVHREDAVVAVDRDHPLDHRVQDGRRLGALLLEVRDLVDEARRHRVERASQGADLVGGAHGHALIELALRHPSRDRFHLDDRPGHAPGDEHADARGDHEGDEPADQQDAVDRDERRAHFGERQRETHHALDRPTALHRHRDVEEGDVNGRAAARGAADLAREGGADLGPLAVVFDAREVHGRDERIRDHHTVGADERDARPGRRRRARRPEIELGPLRVTGKQRFSVVMEEARAGREALRQRIDGGALERVAQIEAGGEHADRDEAHQRQRELGSNAPSHEPDHGAPPSSRSKR